MCYTKVNIDLLIPVKREWKLKKSEGIMTKTKAKFWKKCVAVFVGLTMLMGMPGEVVYAEVDGAEVSYSTDGGATWKGGSLMDAVYAGYGADQCEIKLLRNIILNANGTDANWSVGQVLASSGETLVIDGQGSYSLIRGDMDTLLMSVATEDSTVILKNIIIDGGAVWNGEVPELRENSGKKQEGNGQLISVHSGGTLILESGAVLQNNVLTADGFAGVVEVGNGSTGTLIMKDGAKICNNAAVSGAGVDIRADGIFRMGGGEIYGNYASKYGGAVWTAAGCFLCQAVRYVIMSQKMQGADCAYRIVESRG